MIAGVVLWNLLERKAQPALFAVAPNRLALLRKLGLGTFPICLSSLLLERGGTSALCCRAGLPCLLNLRRNKCNAQKLIILNNLPK